MTRRPALAARDLEVVRGSGAGAFELHVDSIELFAGEALAVLGPNGAGKSTLLRALAGVQAPSRGRIDRDVEGPTTMVFQRPIAFAGTVEHNIRVGLLGQRLSLDQRTQRIAESLERFGVEHLHRRQAGTLSGGELRRLALARALALRPSVLLLDEPFDDLDAAAQEALSLDLRRAIDDTHVALGFVSHDLRRALLLADRIAVLLDGELAQIGPREEVLAAPQTAAVARTVGMVNLLPGRVVAGDPPGPWGIEIDGEHSIPTLRDPGQTSTVWAGIRPEHLKIDSGRGEGVPIGDGRVLRLVSDGWTTTAAIGWAGHELRTHLVAGRGLARTLGVGDSVALCVRPEDVHVIPQE